MKLSLNHKQRLYQQHGLFPHQINAADRVSKYLDKGEKVILHMPTGSGKTRTAMRVICEHMNAKLCASNLWYFGWLTLGTAQGADEFKKAWNLLV